MVHDYNYGTLLRYIHIASKLHRGSVFSFHIETPTTAHRLDSSQDYSEENTILGVWVGKIASYTH